MSPQDTIEHTHLRGPEKRMRTWMYEEIASDGKWRKEKLRAKIKIDEVPAVVPIHRSTESWTQASRIH